MTTSLKYIMYRYFMIKAVYLKAFKIKTISISHSLLFVLSKCFYMTDYVFVIVRK